MRFTAGGLYAAASVALAALAAWPIYRSGSFIVLVVAASLLGAGIAALVTWRRWGGWAAAGLLVAAFFLVGLPLAVPRRLGSAQDLLLGLGEVATGAVFGWKDLLTVDLPVGSYRNLLVPALVVFLFGTAALLLFAWRTTAVAVSAVPVAIAMAVFGLLFGRTEVSSPLQVGPWTLPAPVETALGIGTLLSGVLWLSWRSSHARAQALRRAADTAGVKLRRRSSGASAVDIRRAALGAGMVVVALAVALAVPAATTAERTVLRQATGPRLALSQAVSPLSTYRALFADDAFDQVLFTVSGSATPERVRLAVLDDYDGAVFRTDPDGEPFVRVASTRETGSGTPVDATVTIGALGSIWPGGIWMPSAGTLSSVEFGGTRQAVLADGFYVSDALSAAVQVVPWQQGDEYRLSAAEPATSTLVEVSAPGQSGGVEAPASLRTWVKEHASGSDGAALAELVALLRARGYLSHALTDTGEAAWTAALEGYEFVPSASGHSLARIDAMFTALIEREGDPRAAASDNYVAAIGDDEQFAVAVALIARELGFPSRVVVGVRLSSDDTDAAVCTAGTCRAGDVSAWVEVHSETGEWITVDVTPQHAQAPSREVTEQPDPTIGTAVRPDGVDEVLPPKPVQEDTASTVHQDDGPDLAWLWRTLFIGGVSVGALLVVASPFLLILGAKALRRRARRRAAQPATRIAGGWEEYLDAAADAGR
ncbi:MAG: transglutaminase-like domain-containing protein, partial [Microbacterium sp.]